MTFALEYARRDDGHETIDFNGNGIAGCVACGWRGVPTFLGGKRQTECPACAIRETHEADCRGYVRALCLRYYPYGLAVLRWLSDNTPGWIFRPAKLTLAEVVPPPKVGRNEPCPCGSGKKHKKCCGAVPDRIHEGALTPARSPDRPPAKEVLVPVGYDSTKDTLEHIAEVRTLLSACIRELHLRASDHDRSKLAEPEKSMFDRFTPVLKSMEYGSPEYERARHEMLGAGLEHHYRVNRHHPEHGDTDIEWRPVAGYEGHYEVSSMGDVRSVDRVVARSGLQGDVAKRGQPLKADLTPKGYVRIQLSRDGHSRKHMVHALVAKAFIPNPDGKPEVNHENGVKHDNRVTNLAWVTTSENQVHAYETGLREPAVKYVVYCPELNVLTFGAPAMAEECRRRGYEKVTAAGVWSAMDREGTHFDLTFEGTALAEWRRSQLMNMNLLDLTEMFCDWLAATRRMKDGGDIRRSIRENAERFGYGPEIERILMNTVEALDGPR